MTVTDFSSTSVHAEGDFDAHVRVANYLTKASVDDWLKVSNVRDAGIGWVEIAKIFGL